MKSFVLTVAALIIAFVLVYKIGQAFDNMQAKFATSITATQIR